jgi:hypothetical protein
LLDNCVDGCPVRHVEAEAGRTLPTGVLDLGARLLDVIRVPRGDYDVGALLGESYADGAADSGAGARDQRDLPADAVAHGFLTARGARGCSTAAQSVKR